MTTQGYVYCALLGMCNLLMFRTVFTFGLKQTLLQGFRNPAIRLATFGGSVVTLIGGIAHRTTGFKPNLMDPWAWIIVFGVPLVLGFVSRAAVDPGWISLQQGKALWQRLIPFQPGTINQDASRYRDHPKVHAARELIGAAIDQAPASNVELPVAVANGAIAWQELGLLCRAINEFDEARRSFEISLTLCSAGDSHPKILGARRETLFRLAELDHVTGRRDQARAGYEQSLEIDALLGHDDPGGETRTRGLLNKL